MVFCRECGARIHESAPTCPHCGVKQPPAATVIEPGGPETQHVWLPITSLVVASFSGAIIVGVPVSEREAIAGCVMFSVIALIGGVVSLYLKTKGKGLAIGAIAVASMVMLIALGALS